MKVSSIDYEEKNALQYVAGYVMNAFIQKLQQSAHSMTKELIFCLIILTEHDNGDEGKDADEAYKSEDWTNSVD